MNTQHESPTQRPHRNYKLIATVGVLAAIAIALFAVVGFSGGGSSSANTMAGMNMSAPAGGNRAPVATDAVAIKNFGFSPATITITAGSTVVWTNDDSVQHDITFDGGAISSTTLNHNDTFSHTFTTAGTYHYICSIHPFMHGTVIVTDSGSHDANTVQPSISSGY
jgi:plastocyanin